MTNPALMNSGYERLEDDSYFTIDPRCVYALLEHFDLTPYSVVDPCAPSGSGIVDTLKDCGVKAYGKADAFDDSFLGKWHVTNPPYTRGLVDEIVWHQIKLVMAGKIWGFASFHRWQFDHASSREHFFKHNSFYHAQIKTEFRPDWKERKPGDKNPFHPYIWHVWTHDNIGAPVVLYSNGLQLAKYQGLEKKNYDNGLQA